MVSLFAQKPNYNFFQKRFCDEQLPLHLWKSCLQCYIKGEAIQNKTSPCCFAVATSKKLFFFVMDRDSGNCKMWYGFCSQIIQAKYVSLLNEQGPLRLTNFKDIILELLDVAIVLLSLLQILVRGNIVFIFDHKIKPMNKGLIYKLLFN